MATESSTTSSQESCGTRILPYLFNLIVYSPHSSRRPFLQELTKSLVDNFPSRVIFIEQTDAQPDLVVQVGDAPTEQNRDHVIPCEVLIQTPADKLSKVPFALLPNLVPDLPVALLWDTDPTTEPDILPHLLKFSSRLIFDSESVDNLRQFSQCLVAQADAVAVDIIDLNWARLRGWRDAFDEIFDSPTRIKQASLAKSVKIFYDGRSTPFFRNTQLPALYLQAWLATQLGWQLQKANLSNSAAQVSYTNGSNDIIVELVSLENKDLRPGAVLAVELAGDGYSYTIKQDSNKPYATVHISAQEACELPFSVQIAGPRLKYQFLKDILYGISSRHYLNMLRTLSQEWNP